MTTHEFNIPLPKDKNGKVGRHCPSKECGNYFKVKLGTGLPTTEMFCPYCGQSGDSNAFITQEQLEYAKSIAIKKILEPAFDGLARTVEDINKKFSGSDLISLKVKYSAPKFQIATYRERDIETDVICDGCGLEFSIFGAFASCPDCKKINALSVLKKSLEVSSKKLLLANTLAASDKDIWEGLIANAFSDSVSAFDGFGKKLRELKPLVFPEKPKNLFQNYHALDSALKTGTNNSIPERIGQDAADEFLALLQVRHIIEHNFGVVDEDFIKHVPSQKGMLGRKYQLTEAEVKRIFGLIESLASSIYRDLFTEKQTSKLF